MTSDPGPVPPPPRPVPGPGPTNASAPRDAAGTPHAPTTPAPRWWLRVPLSGRLVGISTVLLLVGLVLAAVTATWLLQRTLVAQVDDKLSSEGRALAQAGLNNSWAGTLLPPTDYYGVKVVGGDLDVMFAPRSAVLADQGVPLLPHLTRAQAVARGGAPFTVASDAGPRWRVVAFPVQDADALVMVALPLGDISRTVAAMIGVLVASGVVILLLGAGAGWWAVRRSLRPLAQIEHTAAAFAAGDLSQRVPPAPTTTEVGRLGAALNGMLAQIEQAFAVRTASEARMRRFVADASHELRTPLAAIRGYGELYRMGALTEKDQVDDTFARIESSATRMGRLVEDLLSLARLDERREQRRTPVDLTVLAADAVSDLHALDPSRTARIVPLEPDGSTRPTVVHGDETHLRQVVANLVGNVVQHTPAGTPVEIAVGLAPADDPTDDPVDAPARSSDGAHLVGVVEVRDHGPGIDPQHAARVFERFYRVDASRGRDSGGAGLGMAIVAAIVAAHDGRVRLAQTPGGGTTVRVELPATSGAPTGESPDEA